MAISYEFDPDTSVATISMNDGRMNAFGFEAFKQINYALDSACAHGGTWRTP